MMAEKKPSDTKVSRKTQETCVFPDSKKKNFFRVKDSEGTVADFTTRKEVAEAVNLDESIIQRLIDTGKTYDGIKVKFMKG